jgi:hypothetical protein
MPLFKGVADLEEAGFSLAAKDLGDIACPGQAHLGVMLRYSLNWLRSNLFVQHLLEPGLVAGLSGFRPLFHHQRSHDLDIGIQGLPVQARSHLRCQADLQSLIGKAWVSCPQQDIGDQAVEEPTAAFDHHKSPFLDVLGRDGQACLQVGF